MFNNSVYLSSLYLGNKKKPIRDSGIDVNIVERLQ